MLRALLRTYQDVGRLSRSCIHSGEISLSHTHMPWGSFSNKHTHTHTNQEGHQVKGYKARAQAKEKAPVKEQRAIEKRDDWINNKVKAQIAKERLRGNCFLATGRERLNTKRRPKRLKEY